MRKVAIFACVLVSGMCFVSCPGKQAEVYILTNDDGREVPVVVVSGTPFEMGYQHGQAMKAEIHDCADCAYAYILTRTNQYLHDDLGTDFELTRILADIILDISWVSLEPYVDERVIEEMRGIGAGSGVGYDTIRRIHTVLALMPFSCTSICAWHEATADGHLYQSRNLDFSLDSGLQEYPCIVVYKPDEGHAQVNFGFTGFAGCHAGMSEKGLIFTAMGDSPFDEMPYDLRGEYFLFFFRRFMYDADNLSDIYSDLQVMDQIKRYFYVFGDGVGESVGNPYGGEVGGMKVKAHAPDNDFRFWFDNDPTDEVSPANDPDDGFIAPDFVYFDNGRGGTEARNLMRANYGTIDHQSMYEIAASTRMDIGMFLGVFDGTDLVSWLRWATLDKEAYETSPFYFDLKDYLD